MHKENESQVKKNILITGGSGFIGSHIADSLSDAGHSVTILDLNPSQYLKPSQKMTIVDIMDFEKLNSAMHNIDIVFHLAAVADMDIAHNKPVETMQINVLGTTNVLEAARLNGVKKIIFGSTIYVNSRTGSFYRVSKQACELLIEAYHERYGLDYTILRFGTLYGPRSNEHNSVYRYLKDALTTKKIICYGSGDEVREYIHVFDAAKICLKMLDKDYSGEALILTGHHRMKLSELLSIINEILNNEVKIIYNNKASKSHYTQTPYSFTPRVGKKIISTTYCDLGQSLVEILEEIHPKEPEEEMNI